MNQKELDEQYAKCLGYDTFNYSDTRSRNEKEKYNVIDLWEQILAEKTKLLNSTSWQQSNATIYYDLRLQLKDGRSIDGKIIPNSSNDGYSPFNYNVVDENDNVVDVVQKGKTKITMYQIDGVN